MYNIRFVIMPVCYYRYMCVCVFGECMSVWVCTCMYLCTFLQFFHSCQSYLYIAAVVH